MGHADAVPSRPGCRPGTESAAGGGDAPASHARGPDEAATRTHIETERKFEAPHRWTTPRLAGTGRVASVGAPQRLRQTATYLDTVNLDLLRAKHTLRRRTGGSDAGWHLKKPSAADSRLESWAPLGRGVGHVPAELRAEVAELIGSAALVPVAVLHNRRTRRELRAQDGTVLALLEDDSVEARVLIGGERIQRWREVELELVDGTVEDLDAVTGALLLGGLTPSSSPAKLARALSEVLADRERRRTPRAGEVVLRYLSTQVGVLQATDDDVRADRPDAVHRARVATRRLRSALRSYRPLLDRSVSDPLRAQVKWLTGVLGEPRDGEVMRERLLAALEQVEPELVRGPVAERMRRALFHTHTQAHARLVAALDTGRYLRLMESLAELLVHPPFSTAAAGPAAEVLPGAVGASSAAVGKAAARAARIGDEAARSHAIHDVRKRAKAARYAAEAAGTHLAGGAKKVVSAWTDVQEALGERQDSVVAREVLEQVYATARKAKEDTFTYGVLYERQAAIGREIEGRSAELLTRARRAATSAR